MLLIAAVICEILACAEVDIFIPSFPELQKLFKLTPFMVQLTVSVNFVSYCLMTLFIGPLSDRYGRKNLMIYGLWLFLAGSVFCTFAPNFPILLGGRFLQGLGMAGPATLAYVVIADNYSKEQQTKMLGILNGVVSASMAFAPVVGSFVNMYFSWRGNFVILLFLGVIALGMCIAYIPHDAKNDKSVSLSLTSYIPLLRSLVFMNYFWGMVLLIIAFWTFIGMGSIIYMDGMHVNIGHFGFYQGAVAASFCLISFTSPLIMDKFGQIRCFKVSSTLLLCVATLMGIVAVFVPDTPMIITGVMMLFAMLVVCPINVLWPASLEVVEGAKARASAFLNVGRLLGTAISLEAVSYVYTGHFFHTGLVICGCTFLTAYFFSKTEEWDRPMEVLTKSS